MQQLIFFLKRYRNLLYFILLQIVAFALTVNNYRFHKSKVVSSTNMVSGSMINASAEISDYFNLKQQNDALIIENSELRNQLTLLKFKDSSLQKELIDTLYHRRYTYVNGKIRKNEFQKSANFLTIDLGKRDGLSKEMAVINDKGIVGITDNVSRNYARVQSILNRNTKINARFKNNFYFGTLTWDGKDCNVVQLTDIPRQATYKKGDSIITGGKSTIFPEGLPIGSVLSLPNKKTASNKINVKLFNDMSNLGYIYVIKSHDKIEVESLENPTDE